jgi:aspartate/methionine/tyrosine aminotransferase
MIRTAERVGRLNTESAFDVLNRARELESEGRDVIHLEIGEPDFATPQRIVEAGQRALAEGWTHYGPPQGDPELREEIAMYVRATRGIPVDAANVCVTPGAKPILFFTMLAALEPGDEVIYPDPGFPIYESMIRFCHADPVPVPLVESLAFSFDLDIFRDRLSEKTAMVLLNSPENPTGGVIPPEDIRILGEMLRERDDIVVLSDEIYSRMVYQGEARSIAAEHGMLDKTVILDGFSKTYAMTGWRLGWGVMPATLVSAVNKLMVNSNSCTAAFTQRAGIEALRGSQDDVAAMVAEFRQRCEYFVAGLNTVRGFRCNLPAGAFYAFANIQGTGIDSKSMEDKLLREAGVAALSGASFGRSGEGYIRFSVANSLERLMEAAQRMRRLFGEE